MKRFLIAAALLIAGFSPAMAECLQWGRAINSGNRVCMMDDAINRNPIIPDSAPITGFDSLIGSGGITITNSSTSVSCPDGYQTVWRSSGTPACARDVIDAK